ncbi:hypothetical protein [Roseovarius aquimarinus]|uniref:Uncharacterized protein n=1 Tax=Roseovarius aquimarinus TaxID=1229156 RepID=A0ABW7I830_9RHOB
MKAFLTASVVAIVIAIGASFLLNDQFQTDSQTAFTTEGVRLSTGEGETASY